MSGAKYRDLSQLLAFIGAHSNGVTVKQVMHETERSRATVDRMVETLRSMQLVERAPPNGADHHRTVRWKACLKSNSRSDLPTDLSYSERSDLERLLPTLDDREGKSGLMKLLSREKPLNLSAIYDLSELVERDANVGRIGPQNIISKETREIVDEAIKGFQKISFVYRDELTARTVSPAGILFARFTYLVGFDRDPLLSISSAFRLACAFLTFSSSLVASLRFEPDLATAVTFGSLGSFSSISTSSIARCKSSSVTAKPLERSAV